MQLSVGYPVLPQAQIAPAVEKYHHRIGEVYFAWRDAPSGRMPMGADVQARMEEELPAFRALGIRLCLLVNGNCYGAEAVSARFADGLCRMIDQVGTTCGRLDAVTTTSPFAAHVVKTRFPAIEVKASVNMRIGTVEGMTYMKHLFDGFYVQRELNRDLQQLRTLRNWADDNGKKLYGLLNSGCLNHCSNQTFHDNLVAHEREIHSCDPLPGFNPVACHAFYSDPENRRHADRYSNWIRPEDLDAYRQIFDLGKLATRMHGQPAMVIGAYARQAWPGNLADLLEPRIPGLYLPNRPAERV